MNILSFDQKKNHFQIISDGSFFLGFDQFMRQRLSHSRPHSPPNTYAYVFDHRGEKSMTSFVGGGSDFFGVAHADDVQYLFPLGRIFNITKYSERDLMIRNAMIELWTNFALYGWVFEFLDLQ